LRLIRHSAKGRHRISRRSTRLALAAVLVGGLSAGVAGAMASAGPASAGCQPVWFIGARGSGELASGYDGMGPAVDHMAQTVKADLAAKGLGMTFMPVNYTAASVNVLKPNATVRALLKTGATAAAIADWVHTSMDAYDASVNDGIQAAEDDAQAAVSQCPNVKLVMGGYSQGAIAIHDAEVWLAATKPAVFSHVAGTLLLADPDRVPNTQAKNFGDPLAAAGGEGVRTWLCAGKYLCAVTPHDVPAPNMTANIVDSGDLVGDFTWTDLASFSGPASIHTHYATCVNGQGYTCRGGTEVYEPELATAAQWVASLIPAPAAPPPPPPATTPAPPPATPPPAPAVYHAGRQVTIDSHATGGVSGHTGQANSYATGPTRGANSPIWIVCYVNGQSITGPYDTTIMWDLSDDGLYYTDAWLYTGTNGPAVPACALKTVSIDSHATGGVSGHLGPDNSYQVGPTHPANTPITIACYVNGQAITGPYDTTTMWDLAVGGYYYTDAWLYTGTNGAAVPHC
jgi:hypothetical protein